MELAKKDVNLVLELLRFLPNFQVSKQDILKITPPFAISFYHRYLNELLNASKSLLSYNFEDDVINYCPPNINFEMFLFLLARHILNEIGISYFNLCDFYRPSGRTKTTIKICMNFLLYFQDNAPVCKGIVDTLNEKVEKNEKRRGRKYAIKNELSEVTSKNGLLLMEVEQLENQYQIESDIFESFSTNNYVDDEIEQLQKQFESLSRVLHLQEQELKDSNDEIEVLSDQIVDENEYSIYKDRVKRLETEIEQNERSIDENTELLGSREKQLEHFVRCRLMLEKIDLSDLEGIEQIRCCKQEIAQLESNNYEDIIDKRTYILQTKRQSVDDMGKKFEKEISKLKQSLLEVNKKLDNLSKDYDSEENLQTKLVEEYSNFRQALEESENKRKELQSDLHYIEDMSSKVHEILLGSLSLITTNFYDNLKMYDCEKF